MFLLVIVICLSFCNSFVYNCNNGDKKKFVLFLVKWNEILTVMTIWVTVSNLFVDVGILVIIIVKMSLKL